MPSRVICDKGHWGGLCRAAAAEIAGLGQLAPCSHDDGGQKCGAPRRYLVFQHYPNFNADHGFEIVRVARLYDDAAAEDERHDPMLFLLKDRQNGEECILPFYWTINAKGRWHVGQFPPILTKKEFQQLLDRLG